MNRMIKYGLLVTMFFMASCGDFLEPKSQSEYVPKLVKSLDELLLGEVYMGPGYSDGQFYGVLGLFDDDVAIRPDWKANASEEEKINKIRMAYTWAKNMKDEFSGYNTYGEVYKKILGCNSVLDYIDEVQGSEEERNRVMAQALAFRGYFYFHLINLYGKPYSVGKDSPGVPLKLTAEMGTSGMKRNTVEEVYTRIIQDLLEAEGAEVLMLRETDEAVADEKQKDMEKRRELIETSGQDVTVSNHQNRFDDPDVCGPQVFYAPGSVEGEKLARCVQESMNEALEVEKPRKQMEGNYYIVKSGAAPAVIVECGFLSNPTEEALLLDPAYQQKIGQAIADGLEDYVELLSRTGQEDAA